MSERELYTTEEKDLLKSLFKKYTTSLGYITFENHITVHLEFMMQLKYRPGKFTEEQFNINRIGIIESMKLTRGLVHIHHMQRIPIKVDLGGL